MSAPTLSEFTSEIRSRNVSKSTLFYVEFILPKMFVGAPKFNGSDHRLVSMFCHSASTPQSTIYTRDEFLENGIRRKYAYDQDYTPLSMSFYVDMDFKVKRFFDQWKRGIVEQRRQFNYPDEYTAPFMNLIMINSTGNIVYKYEYSNIFPKSFNMIDMSYTPNSAPMSMTVDFVYEEVYYSSISGDEKVEYTSRPINTDAVPTEILQINSRPSGENKELYQDKATTARGEAVEQNLGTTPSGVEVYGNKENRGKSIELDSVGRGYDNFDVINIGNKPGNTIST